jgi:hypothetical protein
LEQEKQMNERQKLLDYINKHKPDGQWIRTSATVDETYPGNAFAMAIFVPQFAIDLQPSLYDAVKDVMVEHMQRFIFEVDDDLTRNQLAATEKYLQEQLDEYVATEIMGG